MSSDPAANAGTVRARATTPKASRSSRVTRRVRAARLRRVIAPQTGAKQRTPNGVSPNSSHPARMIQATSGPLL